MEFFTGLLGLTAVDKGIADSKNEIKFDNFISQAKDKNILTLIPNCKNDGLFGSSIVDNKFINDAYFNLYYYLVKKEIIKLTAETSSIFTWDGVYTIDLNKSEIDYLKQSIKKDASDFPSLLKCYEIDYEKLSVFLKNYKYSAIDEVNFVTKGGKNKKSNKNRTKKRKTKRSKK
jgi:hypothetical protein